MSDVRVVKFDDNNAVAIYPRPELKQAALVATPRSLDGSELPTVIQAEWGQPQMFLGDFYVVIRDGGAIYGSAKIQWEFMHTRIDSDHWVKTAVPVAYQAAEPCVVVTVILQEDNSLREAKTVLDPGDWIVKQPGGEVQHIRAAKFDKIYFSREEAIELGLVGMSQDQFATWAIAQVRVGQLV